MLVDLFSSLRTSGYRFFNIELESGYVCLDSLHLLKISDRQLMSLDTIEWKKDGVGWLRGSGSGGSV